MRTIGNVLALLILSACTTVSLKHLTVVKDVHKSSRVELLHLDGYYYQKIDSLSGIKAIFLYADGTVLSLESFIFGNEDSLASFITRVNNDARKYGEDWGYYAIKNDAILIQTVEMLSSGGVPAVVGVLEYEGVIVSDSSFVINRTTIPRWNKVFNENITYTFKEFSPKPDSANWVKEKVKEKE